MLMEVPAPPLISCAPPLPTGALSCPLQRCGRLSTSSWSAWIPTSQLRVCGTPGRPGALCERLPIHRAEILMGFLCLGLSLLDEASREKGRVPRQD